MVIRQIRFTVSMVALFAGAALAYGGGWSVITVRDFPDHAVAGKPMTLTFTVRQHGNNLIAGLKPSVAASGPDAAKVTAIAAPTGKEGEYAASLVFPTPGDWKIRIDGGFNAEDKTREYNSVTLAPLRVIRANGQGPAALTKAQRGEQLFAAKGCVGCHSSAGGRDLTGKRFAPEYLSKFLANPSLWQVDMPNLDLRDEEIGALIAFINK